MVTFVKAKSRSTAATVGKQRKIQREQDAKDAAKPKKAVSKSRSEQIEQFGAQTS